MDTANVEPLSPEEETALRSSVEWLDEHGKQWAGREDVIRLLATIDGFRDALFREHMPLHTQHDPAEHIAIGYDVNHCGVCASRRECSVCQLLGLAL